MYNLNKQADDLTIKSYFEGVHELLKTKGTEAFCVNLDEVWPLVYERKESAVKALLKDYFEGVDYTTQNVDDFASPTGGAKTDGRGGWKASHFGKVVSINNLRNGVNTTIMVTMPTRSLLNCYWYI